ncbi:hypothetical protein [Chryseobacterium sp. JV274]|uniref:hypothetical protein n=1 Tax=Chryseobacterium sp. JV274 TaxID=1932669 RepID=UPI0015C2A2C5|nr:hypothetical protein [Chryseobacterium sp. JV274]CAD0220368.1 protein of unknown function [Chryseobacterium sp. JV274]
MKIRSKICEIQYLSMLCKTIGFDCFTDFAAHVNQFSVSLHNGKWNRDSQPIKTEFYVEDSHHPLQKADSVIYQLKQILKKNKINYSELIEVERIEIDYRF